MSGKDQEIAQLKAQLATASSARGSVSIATLKVVATLVLLTLGVFGCMAAIGSMLPAGQRFESACHAAVPEPAIRDCMEGLQQTYRGSDDEQYKRNAAAQWARNHNYGPASR